MKKQAYIDMGLSSGLSLKQIENILLSVLEVSKTEFFQMKEIPSQYIYDIQKKFFDLKNGGSEEYITQQVNFYGRNFLVTKDVLIPRNDTEVLVKHALNYINTGIDIKNTAYIDVGTGSGVILLSLIEELTPLHFSQQIAIDLSQNALEIAKKNSNQLTDKEITFIHGNLLEPVFTQDIFTEKNLCITANLPYIRQGDHINMDKKVLDNEPDLALYGGANTGFELYETLIKQCCQLQHIKKFQNIDVFIEIGFDQAAHSRGFLQELGLSFEYFSDSSNIERVIHIYGF